MRLTLGLCALALLLPLASGGPAQAQATTTCNQFGGTLTCNTTADPMLQMQEQQQRGMDAQRRDLNAFMAQAAERRAAAGPMRWQDVPPKRCTTLQRLADDWTCPAREIAANRKAVGDLIAAGDCSGALKGALGTGDLQFATEVRDFCGAK